MSYNWIENAVASKNNFDEEDLFYSCHQRRGGHWAMREFSSTRHRSSRKQGKTSDYPGLYIYTRFPALLEAALYIIKWSLIITIEKLLILKGTTLESPHQQQEGSTQDQSLEQETSFCVNTEHMVKAIIGKYDRKADLPDFHEW